jgi:RNA binding motif
LLNRDGEYAHQVKIDNLLRFNTIKQHTQSPAVVVQVAKTIPSLIVSGDDLAIGRKDPFTVAKMDENIPVSLYISNIPSYNSRYEVSNEDVRNLFPDAAGIVLTKLRFGYKEEEVSEYTPRSRDRGTHNKQRGPLGDALVEFDTAEHMEAAAAEVLTVKDGEVFTPKRELKLKDKVLSVMYLTDYVQSKKKRKSHDNAAEGKEEKKQEADVVEEKEAKRFEMDWNPGCVIAIKGIEGEKCDREAILKAVAEGLGITEEDVKSQKIFADYSRGQTEGAIRFLEPSETIQALCDKLCQGDVKVAETKVEASILAGDEETKYWETFIEFKNKQIQDRIKERSTKKKQRRNH